MARSKIILIFLLFTVSLLYAQDFFIDFSNDEPRFIQRLVWEEDEYAMLYEVVIEVYDYFYRLYFKNSVNDPVIEVSLPPGQYRYNVTTYDFLGRQGETSEWKEFEVIPAYQPKIERYTPNAFHLDQRLERVLYIVGDNITEESEIYLRRGSQIKHPVEIEFSGNRSVRLHFDDDTLITGVYEIYILNTGGLEWIEEGFAVKYRKPLDFYFKVLYTPVITIYGEMNDIFGTKLFLSGLTFSLEAISSRRSTFNGGLDLTLRTSLLNPAFVFNTELSDIWKGFANIQDGFSFTDIDINIVLQKRFNKGLAAVTLRFGMGFTFLNGTGKYFTEDLTLHLNFGLTGILYLYDGVNLEAGLDFVHYYSENPFGFLKPRIGLVWQF
ncbi:MAG: hypothetical protein FWD26_03270 [Treponema sp.]|nr:hypothetical protein [Treponema sp.]